MVLVGSHALSKYVNLDRKLNDWDFWVTSWEELPTYFKQNKPVKDSENSKVYLTEHGIVDIVKIKDETDKEIYKRSFHNVETPFGEFHYPGIADLSVIAEVSAECYDRVKYKSDLLKLKSVHNFNYSILSLYTRRLEETRNRINSSNKAKYEFFHKYELPEHIEHDLLHVFAAEHMNLPKPTYELFIDGETTPSEQFFNNLPHELKISRFIEESMVLSWERWLVPNMFKSGVFNKKIFATYFQLDNVNSPARRLLNHVCLKGLRDEPRFMCNFGTQNFPEIENKYLTTIESLKDSEALRKIQKKIIEIKRKNNDYN